MHYVGAIDEPGDRISGWAVTNVGDICLVTATVNGAQRFTRNSDDPRPDLAAKQQSRGQGGFRIDIASALVPGANRIEVTFPDGSHLPGSPIARDLPAHWQAPPSPRPAPILKLASAVPHLTLAELEDISLDDVSHAVANGIIAMPKSPQRLVVAPLAASPAAAPPPLPVPPRSWLSRLARRCRPRQPTEPGNIRLSYIKPYRL